MPLSSALCLVLPHLPIFQLLYLSIVAAIFNISIFVLKEYLAPSCFEQTSSTAYLAQHELFEQCPVLRADIPVPSSWQEADACIELVQKRRSKTLRSQKLKVLCRCLGHQPAAMHGLERTPL